MHGFDPTAALLLEGFPVDLLAAPLADVCPVAEIAMARSRVADGTLDAMICEVRPGTPSILILRDGELELTRDHVLSGSQSAADAIVRLDSMPTVVVVSQFPVLSSQFSVPGSQFAGRGGTEN